MPHILIVDDHEFVREALCNLIKIDEPAWQLSEATDGKEAVEIFRKIEPEVVVLDIVMDGMNGVAAAYEMRKIAPGAKFVFISNHYTRAEASMFACVLQAAAFVQKAEAARALIPTIKRLLAV
jgi:NarL family two-component system response regulator LiaR